MILGSYVAGKKKSQDRGTVAKAPVKGARGTTSNPAAAKPPVSPMSEMDTTEKIVWISLHVLIFLVPLAMSNANWLGAMFKGTALGTFWALPLTYDQFDIAKVFVMRAAALVGAGAWAFTFFWRGGTLRRTKIDWFIVAILGWVLLTSFTSISPATAIFGKYRRFEGLLAFVTYAVTFFLTIQVVDRPSRIRSIARTLVVSAMVVAFYGLLQYTGHDPVNWGSVLPFEANRSFASYGNPDLLGGFLIFPLTVSLAMALTEQRLRWRITYWLGFGLVTVCWVTAFTRGAWIGGAVALLLLIVAAVVAKAPAFRPKEPTGQVDIVFGGVAAIAAAAVVSKSLTTTSEVMNVWSRLRSIFDIASGSGKTRIEIWQAAWDAIKTRPLTGWGADTFRLVFPKFKPAAYTIDAGYLSVADNVHDYPLQVTSALGVPGFLLLYGTFAYALVLGFGNAFSRDRGADRLVVAKPQIGASSRRGRRLARIAEACSRERGADCPASAQPADPTEIKLVAPFCDARVIGSDARRVCCEQVDGQLQQCPIRFEDEVPDVGKVARDWSEQRLEQCVRTVDVERISGRRSTGR